MLVKLQTSNGSDIWINPDHVLTLYQQPPGLTQIAMAHLPRLIDVRGEPATVAAKLGWSGS